ncbi:MAG: ABC transporter permease, partial [Sphingomonas sp.]|nr:ABC transporter permease [Sphingomonas sp.]
MWRNYLTVGIRALAKNKVYAFINIFGLAIGMAACLLILLFVRYELNYDRWIPGSDNIYQFQSWYHSRETGEDNLLQMTSYAAGVALKKDFPQVQASVYAYGNRPVFIKDGQAIATEDYIYADDDFLNVIPLPVLRGSNHLTRANQAVVTQSEALRRFGTDDAVGKTLSVISKGQHLDFQIVGVLKDLPRNSHMKINAIARLNLPAFMGGEARQFMTCWGCQNGWVYMRLKPGTDVAAMQAALAAWEKRNIPDEITGDMRINQGDEQDWHIVNVKDVHLSPAQVGAMTPGNDRRTIATFAIIALLILGMAVVNFTNLATARASQRAREVALRKVLGANRRQLITQFIGESLLIAALAMVIALAMAELSMPYFANFLNADLSVSYLGSGGILLPVIGLVLLVGVLGGLYPAFFLSRFQPAAVLKANKSSADTAGSGRLRSILVVCQFAVSIGLIICTAVVYLQTVYARTVDPGFNRDRIVQIEELSRYQLLTAGDMIVEQMKRVPGVQAVGRTGIGVATNNNNNTGFVVPGKPEPVTIGNYNVDSGFKDAMGLKLIAGRWIDETRPMDDLTVRFPSNAEDQQMLARRGGNIVVNELAARRLGFADPADAVGKTFKAGLVENQYGLVPVTIVGVVADARFRSIRVPLDPIAFVGAHQGHQFLMVRYHGDPAAVRSGLERAWKGITREVPFTARFSEDVVQ